MTTLFLAGLATETHAQITEVIGSHSSWPTTWHSLNNADGTTFSDARTLSINPEVDFVGDASLPAGYWAADASYVYFRMRLQQPTYLESTFNDSLLLLIDYSDGGSQALDGTPDYSFAYDGLNAGSKTAHGLELQVAKTVGTTWATTKMEDIDGQAGTKRSYDFNGASRTTDGYMRFLANQGSFNGNQTGFIDIAASWDFLQGSVPGFNNDGGAVATALRSGQAWRVQFGSISAANDHANIATDVGANSSPTDSGLAWSQSFTTVPEPASTAAVFAAFLGGAAAWLRRHRNRTRPD